MTLPWVAALLGGLVALDGTSVGQLMISRPLVAGLIVGAALGDPQLGFGVGALLEIFAIVAVPTGGVRLNELSVASVVAVAVAVQLPPQGRVPVAIAFAFVAAEIGGFSVDRLRHWNTRRWEVLETRGLTPGGLSSLHWTAVAADFFRGCTLVLLLVPLGAWALQVPSAAWPLTSVETRAILFLAMAVHAGVLLKNWGGWKRRRLLLLVGISVGLGMGVWL